MDIKHYYENTELTLQEIANKLGISLKAVWGYTARNYSQTYRASRKAHSYRKSKLGDLNPMTGNRPTNYSGGPVSDSKGYLLVLKPDWYTGRKGSRHVFQHHVVVCENMGLTEIPKGYCVHHCDEDTQHNSFSNLMLMTMGDHAALHSFLEGATTISKESTAKWLEARRLAKAGKI